MSLSYVNLFGELVQECFRKMTRVLWLMTFFIYPCILAINSSRSTAKYQLVNKALQSNNRSKRFLTFQNGGILKLVLGFSQPMDLLDKHPYRQLSVSYSFHFQYNPPTIPVYWWTYLVNSTAWAHSDSRNRQRSPKRLPEHHLNEGSRIHKRNYHHNPHLNHYGTFVQRPYRQPAIVYDVSRAFVYKAIETVFNSKGLPGERCLLRAICDISQRPLHESKAINRIINAIFSPSVSNIDEKYLRAKQIGDYGLNCKKVYWSCNKGVKWLEQ